MNKYIKYLTFFLIGFVWMSFNAAYSLDLTLPERSYSIISTAEGFYPQKLALFAGEKVRLFLTATTKANSCFIMDSKNLFLGVEKGKVTELDIYFDRPGEHRFYCPTGKIEGKFIVLETPTRRLNKKEKRRREIASEHKPGVNIWMPAKE